MAAKVKVWLQDRWSMLFPLLQPLTVEDEEEIKRLCQEEIQAWRARDDMKSKSSLRVPMTATRNEIKKWAFGESTCWLNPRTRENEHIVLKYMNFSAEEWAEMNAPSQAAFEARQEDMQYIDNPDAVIRKAVELLRSPHWYEIAVGEAVVLGRRVDELVNDETELYPCTLYTLKFKGQLKRRDKVLAPYEIPVNCEAALALDAWRRLRGMIGNDVPEDKRLVTEAAVYHFSGLVPPRSGGDLYTHLFRTVYGAIAVFYYCPRSIFDIRYLSTIYGHYWVQEATGEIQRNYITTLHYKDYTIGDAAIAAQGGKRQGIKLDLPGVEVLEAFKNKPVVSTKRKRGAKMAKTDETTLQTEKASKTGFSMYRPKQDTKERLDQIGVETGSRIEDDTLRLLCDEHYQLNQFNQLGVNLEALAALLADAAKDNNDVVVYLASLLAGKRQFKQSYEKRHAGKDYRSMTLSELRDTKTTEAAHERFRRAVAGVIAYNGDAAVPDVRWYINAKIITDLVGGKPSLASEYLDTPEVEPIKEAHHKQYGLTPAYNRRPVSIKARLRIPEAPNGPAYEVVDLSLAEKIFIRPEIKDSPEES